MTHSNKKLPYFIKPEFLLPYALELETGASSGQQISLYNHSSFYNQLKYYASTYPFPSRVCFDLLIFRIKLLFLSFLVWAF